MSDNLLKREFKTRDVQRMRNIITKNTGDKTGVQIGYTKEYIERKEGDVWEENSKKWTIKNGIKMTVTKLDSVRKISQLPLTCPNCHKHMGAHKLNKLMYSTHQECADCVIKRETKLKLEGKFEEYQKNINKQGIIYHIKEMENVLFELAMEQSDESFVTEAGDIETWKGKGLDKQKIMQDIQEYIQKLKDMLDS
jgi:hypothetical protein